MRLLRLMLATLCAIGLTGSVVAFSGTASAAGVHYVALGDSYTSGDGAGNYSGGNCLRSANSYPQLWANAHHPASFDFPACAGAVTSDVLNSELGPVNSGTTLISITIGGNDLGFSSVLQTCVLGSDQDCQNAVAAGEAKIPQLQNSLATLFGAIRSRAPSAHVVVLDYPHLYKLNTFCIGLSNTKHVALNNGADALDAAIAKSTADAGDTFADVRGQFAGHELCSGDGWLHSITLPIAESYHPTATGQADGYLPVFTGAAG